MEYKIIDRASFKRFLGLNKSDKVPDRKTYTGEEQEKDYKNKEVISKLNEKGCRNNPLPDEQKANNRHESKTRARVEHVFGFVENSMHGSIIRTIGIARAKAKIGRMNLTYNICCCVQLKIVVSMG